MENFMTNEVEYEVFRVTFEYYVIYNVIKFPF